MRISPFAQQQDPPRELRYLPHDLDPIDALAELYAKAALAAEEHAARPRPEPVRGRNDPIDVQAVTRLLAPPYTPGQRHAVALCLAGYLAKQGVTQEQAEAVIQAISAGDDDGGTKSTERVRSTYETYVDGLDVGGWSGLVEVVPEDALRELAGCVEPAGNRAHVGKNPAGGSVEKDADERLPRLATLPPEFWEAAPFLTHISDAAHSCNRSADAVLGCVLARYAAFLPPVLAIDSSVGDSASLNLVTSLNGDSGAGKSGAARIARRLVPKPPSDTIVDGLPVGTGQGLAEAYMGMRKGVGADGKKRLVRAQVRDGAFFYLDEGQAYANLTASKESTLSESIRRAAMSETLGQYNAKEENRRVVDNYAFGLVIGFQPEAAGQILDEVGVGTPQRIIWFAVIDPYIPREQPAWPGPLPVRTNVFSLDLDPEIREEIKAEDWLVSTGRQARALIDKHEPLMRIKLAALLCLLRSGTRIERVDWRRAGVVWETSCTVRNQLIDYLARSQQRQRRRRAVEKATEVQVVNTYHAAVERVAERLRRRCKKGPCKNRDFGHWLDAHARQYKDAAIEHGLDAGLFVRDAGGVFTVPEETD